MSSSALSGESHPDLHSDQGEASQPMDVDQEHQKSRDVPRNVIDTQDHPMQEPEAELKTEQEHHQLERAMEPEPTTPASQVQSGAPPEGHKSTQEPVAASEHYESHRHHVRHEHYRHVEDEQRYRHQEPRESSFQHVQSFRHEHDQRHKHEPSRSYRPEFPRRRHPKEEHSSSRTIENSGDASSNKEDYNDAPQSLREDARVDAHESTQENDLQQAHQDARGDIRGDSGEDFHDTARLDRHSDAGADAGENATEDGADEAGEDARDDASHGGQESGDEEEDRQLDIAQQHDEFVKTEGVDEPHQPLTKPRLQVGRPLTEGSSQPSSSSSSSSQPRPKRAPAVKGSRSKRDLAKKVPKVYPPRKPRVRSVAVEPLTMTIRTDSALSTLASAAVAIKNHQGPLSTLSVPPLSPTREASSSSSPPAGPSTTPPESSVSARTSTFPARPGGRGPLRAHIPHDDAGYQCELCPGERFGRVHDLKRHQISKHNEMTWPCDFCHRPFVRRDALLRHYSVKAARHDGVHPTEQDEERLQEAKARAKLLS